MPWPDIFFKAKKRPEAGGPPPLPTPPPEAPKIVEPPPAAAATAPTPAPTKPPPSGQIPRPSSQPLLPPTFKVPSQSERGTRTLPVMHGVILRPPTRPATSRITAPAPSAEPIKNIEQLMTEADPVKTLSQTGSVRMLKRLSPEAPALRPPGTPAPAPAAPAPTGLPPMPAADTPFITPPKATASSSPWPSFPAKDTPADSLKQPASEPIPPVEAKKIDEPAPAATPSAAPISQLRPVARESSILARPATASLTPPANRPPPPALPPMIPIGSIVKRKAKLADVARIVLPPKREETGPLPQPSAAHPASTIRVPAKPLPKVVLSQPFSSPGSESPFMERSLAKPAPAASEKKDEPKPASSVSVEPAPKPVETQPADPAAKPVEAKAAEPEPVAAPVPRPAETPAAETTAAPAEPPKSESVAPIIVPPAFTFVPKTDYEAPKLDPSLVFDPQTMPKIDAPVEKVEPAFEPVPQVDPEAHKSAPNVLPKLDPEAHKTPAAPVVEATSTEIAPAVAPGTREFHLTNGERVAGVVLSETPEAIYVEHASLGVLTIPRDEVATRLVEIILINGDRIVGNIMAETGDTLYVRHASLGMLSVPKAQRSTRVVEAILKNGDRILGEVLTETETFTVIKSATLGTVTVPHAKVSMLNRKLEQIEMKALPADSPALTN